MRVFKACLSITKRRFTAFIIYFTIFIGICAVMTSFSSEQTNMDFESSKPTFTLINRDIESPLIDGLHSYLNTHGEEVILEDEPLVLQDSVFFQQSDYILIIPKGFVEAFERGTILPLETVLSMNDASAYYADMMTSQYLKLANTYYAASETLDSEAIRDLVLRDLAQTADVNMQQFGESQPVASSYESFYTMYAYIILILISICVSTVFIVFRRSELMMRNLCAPLSSRNMYGQLFLYSLVIGVISWVVLAAAGLLLYGDKIAASDIRLILLILLNSFVFMLVALAISQLTRQFIASSNSQHIVANFLSLGLCFMGGIFVPISLFSEGLTNIAKLLPTYWYADTVAKICGLNNFTSSSMAPVWQGMLIQLFFAAAIISVSMLVQHYRGQSESNFTTIHTEVDA